jgi:hypothetical protein
VRFDCRTCGIGCALAAAIASLAPAAPAPAAGIFGTLRPTPPPPATIAGRMGVEMPESAARHGIAFRPFAPPRRILTVALIPPFRGDDVRANRGIAYEYIDATGRRYALAQWPSNGGGTSGFIPLPQPEPGCPDARRFSRGPRPSGIVWSTPRGLVMTLQADGASDARTLETEWRRLIRRGACR